VKTTPATLPTEALPTERIPADVNVIPVGNLAPDELTSNTPPRTTPTGNVFARLNVPPPPTANEGGLTTHAAGTPGVSADVEASCCPTSQPRSKSAPAPNPKPNTVRRPNCFIELAFNEGIFFARLPTRWVRQPRVPLALDDVEAKGSTPAFVLMHYVMWMRCYGSDPRFTAFIPRMLPSRTDRVVPHRQTIRARAPR
jgi:hypothetical protein